MPDRLTVEKIMETDVLTASPDTSVYDAARMMSARDAGALVVTKKGKPIGIFTERDILKNLIVMRRDPADVSIGELMTRNIVTLTTKNTLEDAHQLMLQGDFRHLLVTRNGRVSGIFSIKDLTRVREQLLEQRVREKTGELMATQDELAKSLGVIERDMATAGKMQKDLVKRRFPKTKRVHFSQVYEQAASLGGDFFEVVRIDKQHIGIFMADVMGHGITSAMIAIEVKMKFDQLSQKFTRPGQVITGMNNALIPLMPPGYFVAGFYGIVNMETLEMSYTQFGLPRPVLFSKNASKVRSIPFGHFPLGIRNKVVYGCQKMTIQPGEYLLLYTDGCIEQRNSQGKQFTEKRFVREFKSYVKNGGNRIVRRIYDSILDFADGEPTGDDIAILLCEFS